MRGMGMKTKAARNLIISEYKKAVEAHTPFNSAHEGYAVILEELDELKAEVWKKKDQREMDKLRLEAAQVGAMAMRFLADICSDVENERMQ